jgi:hypothetical protein
MTLTFTGHRDRRCYPARLTELAAEFPGAL